MSAAPSPVVRVRLHVVTAPRPLTRGDCIDAARPCRWSTCRHHLESGGASCSLDVAELGGLTLQEVGDVFEVSRERIRQIERDALRKLRAGLEALENSSRRVAPNCLSKTTT